MARGCGAVASGKFRSRKLRAGSRSRARAEEAFVRRGGVAADFFHRSWLDQREAAGRDRRWVCGVEHGRRQRARNGTLLCDGGSANSASFGLAPDANDLLWIDAAMAIVGNHGVAAGGARARAKRHGRPLAHGLSRDRDLRVAAGQVFGDLPGGVGRGVVDDHDVEVT